LGVAKGPIVREHSESGARETPDGGEEAMISVTITGADDRVDPSALAQLSYEFPFVEWGILLSASRRGTARYPSYEWVALLCELPLRRSAHLCGSAARATAEGILLSGIPSGFDRVQVNGYESRYVPGLKSLVESGVMTEKLILQCRHENALQQCANDARDIGRASVLFDPSGGKGLEPFSWPRAPHGAAIGYAGGINIANVEQVVHDISAANGHLVPSYWIDMESGVRDEDDDLDLDLVREVLEKVAQINGRSA
jgi:N-(5'phosphoribosyl)anthranilate (PRA) isomerase